jgi:hypothetical protein
MHRLCCCRDSLAELCELLHLQEKDPSEKKEKKDKDSKDKKDKKVSSNAAACDAVQCCAGYDRHAHAAWMLWSLPLLCSLQRLV